MSTNKKSIQSRAKNQIVCQRLRNTFTDELEQV